MSIFTAAQAKVSDTKLAELSEALYTAADRLESAEAGVHYSVNDRKVSRHGWHLTLAQAVAKAEEAIAAGAFRSHECTDALERLAKAEQVRDDALAAVTAHSAEWTENGQWTRFFIVQNGHIHSSTACHTLRITTRVGWLPELSGESIEDAVKAHGTVLCTHCFPSAPVAWTTLAPKAADPSVCTGSGVYIPGVNMARVSKYGTCATCGEVVSVTSTGKARKHKAK